MFDFDNFDIVHRPFNKTFDVKSLFRAFDKFKFRTDHGVFRKEYRAAILIRKDTRFKSVDMF